jgi:hypothetical protein
VSAHRETRRMLDAFTVYCAMGKARSIDALVTRLAQDWHENAPSRASIGNWSKWHHWQQRVAAHDRGIAEQELREQQEEEAKQRAERRKERLQDQRLLRHISRETLIDPETKKPRRVSFRRADRLGEDEITPRGLEVVANTLAKVGAEERLDTGEATVRTDVTTGGQPLKMEYTISFDE